MSFDLAGVASVFGNDESAVTHPAWRWKLSRSKIKGRVFLSMCSATMCSRESVLTMRPGTAGQSDSKDHQKKIVFFDDGVYDKCKRAATSRMKNRRTVGKAGEESYVLCTRRHKGVRIL